MFFKIFISFWIIVAVFAAAEDAASRLARNEEQRTLASAREAVDAAREVVAAFDRGGAAEARIAIAAVQLEHGVSADLLLPNRTSITGRPVRPAAIDQARLADRIAAAGYTQAAVNGIEGVAAQAVTAGGQRMTLVVFFPRRSATIVSRALLISSPTRLLFILAIGGVVCFFVAQHLSRPVVRLSAAATALADGQLDTRVGAAAANRRDELGALARDFDRMATRIQALVAGQRRLLGDVSHELRSPLTRMRVAMSLARRRSTTEATEYFDRVERETTRLDRLIEQLLTLARIDGGVEESRAPFDLGEVVQEVVADGDFEAKASCRRVVLTRCDPATVVGTAELLRSAVENVVRNAIRHTPAETTVDVAVRCDESGEVLVAVRDHGPGVEPQRLKEMFKAFWRARAGGEPGDGAGLGLALVERVVAMHGGRVLAANSAEGGLEITIGVPRAR